MQKKWSSRPKAQAAEVLAVVEQEKEPEVEVPAVTLEQVLALGQEAVVQEQVEKVVPAAALEEAVREAVAPAEVVRELAEVLAAAQEEAVPEEVALVAAVLEKVEIQEEPAQRKGLDFLPIH